MEIIDIASRFHWEVPASGLLLAGWIALAPICGAMQWRPHVWLTASAGSGKSAILDRFIGILLEHTGGELPDWLAPEQVRLVPVAEPHRATVQRLAEQLRRAGVRVEIDQRARPAKCSRSLRGKHHRLADALGARLLNGQRIGIECARNVESAA